MTELVTPGLVDAHGHFYNHCTPLGEPADEVCIGRGGAIFRHFSVIYRSFRAHFRRKWRSNHRRGRG
jgi:hypothetical protein